MPWKWFLAQWTQNLGQSSESFWAATPYEFWSMFNFRFAKELKKPRMTKALLDEWISKDIERQKAKNGNNS